MDLLATSVTTTRCFTRTAARLADLLFRRDKQARVCFALRRSVPQGSLILPSGAKNFEPEGPRGQSEAAVMSRHHERPADAVTPHKSGGQVQRVQGSQGGRKRLGGSGQYRALKQDEVDGLQPIGHGGTSGGGFLWG